MHPETLHNIHWLGALLGGLAYFALGALWYSKILFAPKWIEYCKIDVNNPDMKKGVAGIFLGSFILMFLTSVGIALLAYKNANCWRFQWRQAGLAYRRTDGHYSHCHFLYL